jgi:general L-amino acid transport system permease protein
MAVDADLQGQSKASRFWYDPKKRAIIVQIAFVVGIIVFFGFIINNTAVNLDKRGIRAGFDFLENPAGFEIPLTLVPYSVEGGSTHGSVFVIGLLNTLLISVVGIVFATILGFVFGVLRLSHNWLISRLVGVYIEALRNVPLLLQFIFWHFAVFQSLPHVKQSIPIFGTFFIHNRGLTSPMPAPEPGFSMIVVSFVAAIAAVVALRRWAHRRKDETGQQFPVFWTSLGILIGVPLVVSAFLGFPLGWEYPSMGRFRFVGGMEVPIEFFSALAALTFYTSTFIAEIVRAGILAISHGQTEAARALGVRQGPTLRLVIVPQAMRVIVPPLISQYLNLTKNSSLGIAIGYADLFNVFGGISLNQTGQAIEIIAMCMGVYLTFSLLISVYMNWYNKRIALVER